MMSARPKFNEHRALAFGAPVLRSSHPDAQLIGFSVTAINGSDVMVESNHVLRSSLVKLPVSFTSRTRKMWTDPDVEWYFHGIDHLRSNHPECGSAPPSRDDVERWAEAFEASPKFDVEVLIDGDRVPGTGLRLQGAMFVRLFRGTPRAMITIAAPEKILSAGFTSSITT